MFDIHSFMITDFFFWIKISAGLNDSNDYSAYVATDKDLVYWNETFKVYWPAGSCIQ